MYKPSADKKVYRMYLPSDAEIIFNGNRNNSGTKINLKNVAGDNKKVGFKFTSATSYTTYN